MDYKSKGHGWRTRVACEILKLHTRHACASGDPDYKSIDQHHYFVAIVCFCVSMVRVSTNHLIDALVI